MKLLFSRRPGLGVVLLTLCCGLPSPASVRITEIMYHPSSEDVREEFIELHNTGTTNVNLGSWRFTQGIQFAMAPPLNA